MKKFTFLLVLSALFSLQVFSQVTGTVTDEVTGEPIPGANVLVKGTTVGTITNLDGVYSITMPEGSNELVISFVGMQNAEVTIAGRTVVNVALKSEATEVEEVVVTAIGVKKSEKTIGYAATTVGGDDITMDKNRSMLNSLQGKVAGVNISSASGAPGASTKVILRGFTSLSGDNQPLYIIDGVPMNNSASGSTSLNGGTDFGNQANDVNPEDIESITVLKGSGATALYGSRAANGVIVITTKKGKNSKKGTEINYSSTIKFSTPLRLPQLQNVYGQGIYGNWDQRENTSYGPKFDGEMRYWGHVVNNQRLIKPYVGLEDNVADFFEVGKTYQNSLSVTGGDETSSYYMSYSNVNDDGIFPSDKDSYKRNTLSMRGSAKLSNNFTSSASINYVNKKNKFVPTGQGGQSVWNNILQQPRDIPISELANYNAPFFDKDTYYSPYTTNPYWPLMENGNENNEDRVYGMADINFSPNEHFSALFRVGGDVASRDLKQWQARKINISEADGGFNEGVDVEEGFIEEYRRSVSSLTTDLIISYNNKVGDFTYNVLAGHNMNQLQTKTLDAYVTGIDIERFYNISNSYGTPQVGQYTDKSRLIGAYGSAEIGYKSWLTLTVTGRNDWSSTLPPANRSFFYPGTALSFVYSDAFPAIKKVIPYGKLRASWGKTGNDAGVYRINSTYYQPSGFPLPNGVNGFSVDNKIGNPELSSELTTESEIGTDMRFFNNRLGLDITYYQKVITDLIYDVDLAYSTGYTYQTMNLGEISNKGFEVLFTITPIKTKKLSWDLSFTFAKNKSKLVSLTNGLEKVDISGLLGGTEVFFRGIPGQPIGVFEITAPETYIDPEGVEHTVVNTNGVPKLSPDKYKYAGTSELDFMAGLTSSLSYQGFSFNFVFDWKQGGVMYSRTAGMVTFTGITPQTLYNDRQPFIVPNSVMQIGTETDGTPIYVENTIPVTYDVLGGSANSYWDNGGEAVGGHQIIDKTFVKLRSLSLMYNVPKKFLNRLPIGSLQAGIVGNNLLLWTPKSNNIIDPEMTTFGNDLEGEFGEFGATPSVRTVGFNLSFTF